MSQTDPKDLSAYAEDADAWFKENVVRDPGFMLPLTFMEVGTDQQFHFLRDWQHKVWGAGYLGAACPHPTRHLGARRCLRRDVDRRAPPERADPGHLHGRSPRPDRRVQNRRLAPS